MHLVLLIVFDRHYEHWPSKTPGTPCHSPEEGNPYLPMNNYYVYILASKRNGTLHIGMTNNLSRRVFEHKNDLAEGFTKKYHVHTLVYCEGCPNVESAIRMERQMKKWNRQWEINRIGKRNPEWRDLYEDII